MKIGIITSYFEDEYKTIRYHELAKRYVRADNTFNKYLFSFQTAFYYKYFKNWRLNKK